MVKNLPVNARDIRDAGLIPGSERSPGRRHGNPLQYSCLENPMGRGAWWATVHGVAEPDTSESMQELTALHKCTDVLRATELSGAFYSSCSILS